MSLTVTGTTPTNRSISLPLDVLLLTELESAMTDDLDRLAELLPGLVAEVRAFFFLLKKVGSVSCSLWRCRGCCSAEWRKLTKALCTLGPRGDLLRLGRMVVTVRQVEEKAFRYHWRRHNA